MKVFFYTIKIFLVIGVPAMIEDRKFCIRQHWICSTITAKMRFDAPMTEFENFICSEAEAEAERKGK